MYVIRRTDGIGGWVTWPGSERSYTQDVLSAARWRRRTDAEWERCPENEVVVLLDDILGGTARAL